MLLSNDCWMKDQCNKYKIKSDCECKFDNIYCPKLFKLNYLFDEAEVSTKQRKNIILYPDANGVDVAEFNYLNNIKNNIVDFVSNGDNLFIYSPYPGNGKTSWSLKLLQSYFNSIWHNSDLKCRGLFINVPRFLMGIKSNISVKDEYIEHILSNILSADIIIWDDIGTKVGTEFEIENLLNYINTRIDLNKSNIFTSNIIPNNLSDVIGPRLTSRIIGMSTVIGFNGQDKRGLRIQ